ncbi:MAG: glycyl-tRNA synthetase (class II) [Pseudohongiellaceae bacterium]|jgi:glycyl-tRNA synthetase (class II)
MTSSQHCANHPLVAAIGQCANCSDCLCGMYATFADSQVYCEACYKNYETDKLVKATTAKLDSAKPADLLAESEEPAFSIPDKRKKPFKVSALVFTHFV